MVDDEGLEVDAADVPVVVGRSCSCRCLEGSMFLEDELVVVIVDILEFEPDAEATGEGAIPNPNKNDKITSLL